MSNLFSLTAIENGTISTAIDKATALAGQLGLNNIFGGHVLPVLPPIPANGHSKVSSLEIVPNASAVATNTTQYFSMFGTPMCFPLRIKAHEDTNEDYWLLPVEPMISIGGGFKTNRRYTAKSKYRGSIKGTWAQDDYSITINGLLTRHDSWSYPANDFIKLRAILETGLVDVQCQLFEYLGIGRISIEKFDIPFTKGEENQSYQINAFSDDDWNLLIKLNTNNAL